MWHLGVTSITLDLALALAVVLPLVGISPDLALILILILIWGQLPMLIMQLVLCLPCLGLLWACL